MSCRECWHFVDTKERDSGEVKTYDMRLDKTFSFRNLSFIEKKDVTTSLFQRWICFRNQAAKWDLLVFEELITKKTDVMFLIFNISFRSGLVLKKMKIMIR